MKGLRGRRLSLIGIAAVGVALVAGLLLSAQVSAQAPTISIGSAEAEPGDEATVDVVANVPDGLGAWTIDISFDTDVVSAVDCEEESGSVCNPDFADGTVRVTGASASGLDEESVLASITFACEDEGESDLTMSLEVLADATIGDPQDISGDASVEDGSITCAEAVVAPAATATIAPRVIAPTGSGGGDDGSSFGWLIAVLAGAGVAGMAGFAALRARRA